MMDTTLTGPATTIPTVSAIPGALPREAVGIFPDDVALTAAIDDLLLDGFARCQLGLLARTDGPSANLGVIVPVEALVDDPGAPRESWFCPEAQGNAEGGIVSGFTIIPMFGTAWAAAVAGTTLAATTALTLGTGGLGLAAGGALAWWLHHRQAEHLRHQVAAGGLLLWVRTATPEMENRAMAILARHGATHVHVHGEANEASEVLGPVDTVPARP